MAKHEGSCHCGAVTFEVDNLDLNHVTACNCSMCGRSGAWMVFVPAGVFHLKSGQELLKDYQFGRKHIHHPFCSVCGIKPFAHGEDGKGGEVFAVNIRCLDGVELRDIQPSWYDGAAM